MVPDSHQPVIVGVGQCLDRTDDPTEALEPAALIANAARAAAEDAGLAAMPPLDALYVVRFLSWNYRDPARFIANALGADPKHAAVTPVGGNAPQTLVNTVAREIQAGRLDVALLVGGESFRTYMRARRQGVHLSWPKAPDAEQLEMLGTEFQMTLDAERERDIQEPVQLYPLFESALRSRSGRTPVEHSAHLGRLWSDLSAVARDNPFAWTREHFSPEELAMPSAKNRMIGLPYPKRMNSNNDVNMSAALLVCSASAADRLGVPRDRQVFVSAGTDCHEHPFVSHRDDFTRTPAIEIGGRRVLDLAGTSIDDVELIDLYSCFPSAVQLGATALGVTIAGSDRRQWSRTGGMTFAGGPWNSYSMHAIATIVDELRHRDGAHGLVWANGGFVTKHSFGVYSNRPPTAGFRHEWPQAEVDALPARALAPTAEAVGRATVEAYTVMFDRDQHPERAIAACRLADGRRAWGTSTDTAITSAMCDGEWVDVSVDLDATGEIRM